MNSYYYGDPDKADSWEYAASIFAAHESVNSKKTSSLPLVQFWKPSHSKGGLSECAENFLKECGLTLNLRNSEFCFEYPVPANGGKGKASMTDLMIFADSYAIAIEAKWTECKRKYETIKEWEKTGNVENHKKVLNGWIAYINDYLKASGSNRKMKAAEAIEEIPYQLLHRVASACHAANERNKANAIVAYHLFYDTGKSGTVSYMESNYAKNLEEWFSMMFEPSDEGKFPITFHVILTEVKLPPNDSDVGKRFGGMKRRDYNDIFVLMQDKDVYSFVPESLRKWVNPYPHSKIDHQQASE